MNIQTKLEVLVFSAMTGLLLLACGVYIARTMPQQVTTSVGGSIDVPGYSKGAVASSSVVTNASSMVLSTSTSRTYATIQNLSSTTIYCMLNSAAPAIAYQGTAIFASSTLVINFNEDNLYRGAVYCISPSNNTASTTSYDK